MDCKVLGFRWAACVSNVTRREKHDTFELMLILCSSVYAMMHIKHDEAFELCSAKALAHFKLKFYANTRTHRNRQSKANMQLEMSYSNYRYDSLGWVEWKFCRLMEDGRRARTNWWMKNAPSHAQRLQKVHFTNFSVYTLHHTMSVVALKQHLSHRDCGN